MKYINICLENRGLYNDVHKTCLQIDKFTKQGSILNIRDAAYSLGAHKSFTPKRFDDFIVFQEHTRNTYQKSSS